MRLLITGATGFIGQALIPRIIADDSITIMLPSRNVSHANSLFGHKRIKIINIDNWDSIIEFNPEIVIHLAAYNTSRDDMEVIDKIIDGNISYGVKLLCTLEKCKSLKLFVNTGSFSEYRNNDNNIDCAYLYGAAKAAFERFLDYYSDKNNFRTITAILFSVYGGNMTVKRIMDYIADSTHASIPVNMTGGEQCLDFIHVNDVADFYITLINNYKELDSQVRYIQIGTGKSTKIKDIATEIEKISKQKCRIKWGGLPYRKRDIMYAKASNLHWDALKWKAKIDLSSYLIQKYGKKDV